MGAALLVLLLVAVAALACWKRLLGLAVSRFAHGKAFRLTVGQFFFGGLVDVRLRLHKGPVREVRVARIAVSLSTQRAPDSGSEDGGSSGGSLWQAVLNGQLLLPVSLHGVSVRLAPAPPKAATATVAPASAPADGGPAASEGSGAPSAAAAGGPAAGRPAGSKKGVRQMRAPLLALAHLPLNVEGLTVVDEERGVQLRLERLSLSLLTVQQLLLEGLSAGLLLDGGSASNGGSGGVGGSSSPTSPSTLGASGAPPSPRRGPASPLRRLLGAQEQAPQVQTVFQMDRLLLEHQHDGSFSLQHLQLRGAAAAGAALPGAATPSALPQLGLQCLSLQLGATSLTVSKQLLLWVQHQQAVAAQAAAARRAARPQRPASSSGGGDHKAQPLQRLLPLLPKEVSLEAHSCSVATDAPSSTQSGGGGGDSLPLHAAFGLQGISCRLARAAPAGDSSSSGSDGAPLASVTAGWQRLSISLGAAAAAEGVEVPSQQLPAALVMSSGAAEWSLALAESRPAAAAKSSSGGGGQEQSSPLSAAFEVSIGALHTDVCHPAVQPLVAQLRLAVKAAKAAKSASKPAGAGTAGAASPVAAAVGTSTGQQPVAQPAMVQAADRPKRPPLLAQWRASISLGDGSRLLFTDAAGRCCWSSGLASCRLAVQSGGRSSSSSGSGSSGGGDSSSAAHAAVPGAAAGMSGCFEVHGIEMHAVATAGGNLANESAAAAQQGSPPQMLAAKLLRVEVQHGAAAAGQQAPLEQGQQEQQEAQAAAGSTAMDATTAGVHLLVQQQQLATVASVILSLLPPPKAASLPGTPPGTGSDAASADAGALVVAAAAAAAEAISPHASAGSRQQARPRRPAPRLTFSCSDTLLLLPTSVAVPAEHAAGGSLLLVPAAPALLLASVASSFGGGSGGDAAGGRRPTVVEAEGCCLLYVEGPHSQRFPSSTSTLKEQAPAVVLSLDAAKFVQPSSAALGTAGSAGDAAARQLELGAVAVTADADALLCMAAVADSAAQQLMAALAAAPPRPASPKRRQAKAAKQQRPLAVHVEQLSVAQPMSAERDMVLEVAAVHAVVGGGGGTRHSLRTGCAVLSMLGKPVLRWRQLETTLQLPQGDGRLPVQPLSEPWPAAAAEDGGEEACGDGAAAPAGEMAGSGAAAGSPSWEAYQRARLGAWLKADSATAPGAALQPADDAAAAALGTGPASILDAALSGAELIVPHDGEPGPTQRYSELYFKALETAAQQHVQRLKQFQRQRRSSAAGAESVAAGTDARPGGVEAGDVASPAQQQQQPAVQRRKRQLFPMQINLAADDVALRFEHHPLEAWLASRGPLLQQMATQQHLWGEIAAAVQPADSASPLHAAMVESAFATVQAASQQAWEGLMHDLFQQYRGKLQRLQGTEPAAQQARSSRRGDGSSSGSSDGGRPYSAGRPPPDLMLLTCSRLQGLVVLCAGSPEARVAATAQIVAVDPPSEGVPMSKLLKLHLDASLADFEMRLAGASQPMVAASRARLSGAAAVARQATLPPQTAERRLLVGAHRSVPIPVTIKGCRPVFKFYTDARLDADALSVCHSQGLEPALALVSLAGKRLSPGDPDKTVARPPPIPWWDDLRYTWRGPVTVGIRRFGLTLGAHNLPDVDATSERLEASVQHLTARLLSGQYELSGQALRVTLHRSAGVSQLGGTLLALPFVEAPHLHVNVGVGWKLPGGRSAEEHHLFPSLHGPAPPGALQEPIYAGVVYKSDSWDVTLEAELGQPGASAAAAAVADGTAPGPLPALLGPFAGTAAVGYLGGQQVHWMKQYVALVNRLPPQLRQVSRRGSFFWRKPPSNVPKKGFGKMMQQFSLRIVAAPLEIVHFAADPSEPSHGVRLHAPSCSYTARYLMNQPLPSFLKLPPHARASKARRPEPTRTITLGMEVEAGTVTVHKPDSSGPGSDPQGRLDGGGSSLSLGLGSAPGTATAASQRASAASSAGVAAAAAAAAEGEEAVRALGLSGLTAAEESSSLLDDLIAPTSARHQRQPTIVAGVVTVTQDALTPPGSSDDPAADPLADALAPQGSRPLRVLISDCRVLVDPAARDAVWGAVEHLIAAFGASGATQRRRLAQAAAHQVLPTSVASSPSPSLLTASPSMPWSNASPAAQLQRHISESQRSSPLITPAGGASMEFAGAAEAATAAAAAAGSGSHVPSPTLAPSGDSSNELLSLLLQQQAAAGAADGEGQEGGAAAGEGDPGAAGSPARSPALLHPGTEMEDGEDEDAPLSSPADDIHGQLRYTVEVVDLQINAEAEAAQGRLLLAARSGRLRGLRIPDASLNVTALLMEQVSAYVTQTDVDPDAPVVWLQPTPNGYTVPAGQGMLPVRRIFEPIQISLRHSKVSSSSSNGGGGGPARPPRRPSRGGHRRSPSGVGPGGSSRGEELLLKVPEVRAKLDSREFEVLTDVITWAQAPGPSVETVAAEGELLAELPGEEEAEEARRLYALVLQQLGELRRTTLQLRAALGLQAFASQLAAPGPGGLLLPPLEVTHFLVADTADFVAVQFNTQAELGVAMREHLAAASAAAAAAAGPLERQQVGGSSSETGPLAPEGAAERSGTAALGAPAPACSAAVARQRLGERQAEQQQALLLRWVEDQEGGAFEALEKAKAQLLSLKAVARKRQHKHSASRVLLQVDQLVWQLCTPSRDPFIQASIRRLSLDKFKNKDHSGFAKFGIHRIEILDTQGVLGPGPGVPAGVILSVWNPDASWERDDMLRVVATMGVPTQTHIIYDHLDVILHPLAFHLTEGLAVAFWEYFFPREDESKARAAAAFARSVAVPAAAAARHRRSATALPAGGTADYGSHQGSPMPPASPARRSALLMAAEGGAMGSQPSSGGQSPLAAGTPRGSGIVNAGWRSAPSKLHRRSSSGALAEGQQPGGLSRQGTFERQGGAAAAAAAAEASLLAAAAETAAALAAGGMGPGPSGPAGGSGSGSQLARLSAGAMSLLHRTSSTAGAGGGRMHASRSSASLAPSEDAASRTAPALHRKVRFVHVKINRAHCRATYEGYPLTFTDLKLVIDNRTYANIEGRWRDLFNKMKWDIVKSVVKSVAGLQGRKFKELLPEGFPGEEGEGGGRRKAGLLAQLTALSKGRKEAGPGAAGEVPLSEEELREQQKRRMLFGQSWPAAAPKAPQQAQQQAQAQQQQQQQPGGGGGGTAAAASPAHAAGGEGRASGPGSAGVSPRGSGHAEAAAAPGEIYGSLSAAASAAGPLASGAFGSRLGSLELPAPPLHPEDSGSMAPGSSSGRGGQADPAAAALLGGPPGGGSGGGSGRAGLTTPRWAKSLASGAKKGLAKAKEALRDSLQE